MALRVLHIQLDTLTSQVSQIPAILDNDYLGGRGLAVWMLSHQLPSGTSPMSRANQLIFSAGPLSGTGLPATGGFIVSTRSPLTGAIAHSWAEGRWGTALRSAGYDAMVIEGQSAEWCYIQIDGQRVTMRPAGDLVGLDTITTERMLGRALGDNYATLCVGPAGEAGVAYASIVAEGRFPAEPAGTGAVMAHKRIKAIVVRGSEPHTIANPERVKQLRNTLSQRADQSELVAGLRQFGSNYYLASIAERGAITVRNGQAAATTEQITQLLALRTEVAQRGKREPLGCEGCPISCHSRYIRKDGGTTAYPELEAILGFGARCGITNADAIIRLNDACLRLGLDVTSTSAALAFMAECQEEGLSKSEPLPWGDEAAFLAAIERLGQRRERRDILSLGVGEMREVFYGSNDFAPQTNGLAMPALDPRALNEIALTLATSPIGGDYRYALSIDELLQAPPSWLPEENSPPDSTKGKAARLIWHERFAAALDSAGLCRRVALFAYQATPAELSDYLSATLGRAFTGADLAKLGERIVTLERLFAQRYATHTHRDTLPKRWMRSQLNSGPAAGKLPQLEEMLTEYYRRHGWDEQGNPTPKRLADLGIQL
jgi:aldehyde:ferredoxin oxidoreductase